ncbi:uncharacterized protein [Bombus fervidus]|uniref:uncharacterized protein n=1 Tax=Bombus fervidus TaxID=203811 RepID=UPI003AB864FB
MSQIKNAEKELKHSLRLLYPLLRIIGIWPNFISTSVSAILKWCLISICYFLQFLLLIPSFIYIFGKEMNSRKQLKLLVPHINGLVQLTKYTFLLYRMRDLKELMEAIKNDWLNATEENRKIFRKNAEIGYKVLLVVAIIMYTNGLCNRMIVTLLKGRIVLPDNTTIRLLSIPSNFIFFDAHHTPNYEVIFTLQILGALVVYTILCGSLGLASLLCLHMATLLRILANMMIELSDQPDTSENAVHKMIKDIVEYRTKVKQ